jgi:DNA-binding FadR family transcriptional regulator
MLALADAGHALPRPSGQEIEERLRVALPLLREALRRAETDLA